MTEVSDTLAERGGRYGAFKDHAAIAQGLIEVLHKAPNWSKLDPDMRQALSVIMDKTARILNGDPYYEDNWHDIQGYAKLVETRIMELKQEAIKKEAKVDGDNWEGCHTKIDWSKVTSPERHISTTKVPITEDIKAGRGLIFGDNYTG